MISSCPCSSQRPNQERMSKEPSSLLQSERKSTLTPGVYIVSKHRLVRNWDCSLHLQKENQNLHQEFKGCLFKKPEAVSIPLEALGFRQLQTFTSLQPQGINFTWAQFYGPDAPSLQQEEGLSHPAETLPLSPLAAGRSLCRRNHTDWNTPVSME